MYSPSASVEGKTKNEYGFDTPDRSLEYLGYDGAYVEIYPREGINDQVILFQEHHTSISLVS